MSKKKYVGIAKVGYDPAFKQPICVKYRFDRMDKFLIFIQHKFPAVCWINIYYKSGANKGKLCYTWGKLKGLQEAR
jgi:hypothetical protein